MLSANPPLPLTLSPDNPYFRLAYIADMTSIREFNIDSGIVSTVAGSGATGSVMPTLPCNGLRSLG
eukprot:1368684-Amorphochlora_amoeboformis.AAC.1